MIKINLLPVRAAKKKESINQQLTIAGLSVAGVILVCAAVYFVTTSKISATKEEIVNSEQEIQLLKKKIGEIDNIKKLQAEVKKKLDILSQLRKEKSGPAKRLAQLSDTVPDKVWLTRYSESASTVSISGVAFSEELIAQFMRNLQGSEVFSNIDLQVSEQVEMGGVKTKKFEITCSLQNVKKEEPPSQKK
jgi:type IV pilus assembly protein PilN